MLTSLLIVPFLPESPRFLVTKGRYEEAQVILDRFASEASNADDEPLLAPDISLFVIEKPVVVLVCDITINNQNKCPVVICYINQFC